MERRTLATTSSKKAKARATRKENMRTDAARSVPARGEQISKEQAIGPAMPAVFGSDGVSAQSGVCVSLFANYLAHILTA